MKAEDLKPGLHYTFRPDMKDKEKLPVINASCIGREIDYPHDVIGTIRIFPNDLVKLVELRADSYTVLVTHPRASGPCITDIYSLSPADQPNSAVE